MCIHKGELLHIYLRDFNKNSVVVNAAKRALASNLLIFIQMTSEDYRFKSLFDHFTLGCNEETLNIHGISARILQNFIQWQHYPK